MSGLKYVTINHYQSFVRSHPTRGVWIEMTGALLSAVHHVASHPVWGEWIEIIIGHQLRDYLDGLTPHGMSGLKYGRLGR